MPRFWYVFGGPQTVAGYAALGNYVYYNNPNTNYIPPCTSGANICAIYSVGPGGANSNPDSISDNQSDRIAAAKADEVNKLGPFGGIYVRVRTTP